MDDDRGPGAGPLTWATLGLLSLSWLSLGWMITWDLVRDPSSINLSVGVAIGLFISGPHLLFGAAAWRSGGQPPEIRVFTFLAAILFAGLAILTVVRELTGVPRTGETFPCCVWAAGWLFGIMALHSTFGCPEPPGPPDTNRH